MIFNKRQREKEKNKKKRSKKDDGIELKPMHSNSSRIRKVLSNFNFKKAYVGL
jgi:hypothetical protein